jgi:NAD-dependent SIR2 family protein deacetylase
LETQKPHVWVLTQNVDGLHRKAGSKNLIEAHGHGFDLYCTRCRKEYHADELLHGYRQSVRSKHLISPRVRYKSTKRGGDEPISGIGPKQA